MIFYIEKFTTLDTLKSIFYNNYFKLSAMLKFNNNFQEYIEKEKIKVTREWVISYIYSNILFSEDRGMFKITILKDPEKEEVFGFIKLLEFGNLSIKRDNTVSRFILTVLDKSELDVLFGG